MSNAFIIHGKANKAKYYDPRFPSPSNSAWLPWLQKQLLASEILAQTPEMPVPFQPDYASWTKQLESSNITAETMLIGHSCGAGFILRWLSDHQNIIVGKVALVAPWIDPDRTGDTGDFFNCKFDPLLANRTAGLMIFASDDDFEGAEKSVQIIQSSVENVGYLELKNRGHLEQKELIELRDYLLRS